MDDDDDFEDSQMKKTMPDFSPKRVFNGARVYRDMAKYCMRMNSYDVARSKLDLAVSFTKRDDDKADSLYLRSKCLEKMIDIPNAMADCDNALSIKTLPHIAYLKGSLLYKQNRFEDAMGTFVKNTRAKPFPDQFDYGMAMVSGTMQNCVGRNAGPLRKYILELKTNDAALSNMDNEENIMYREETEKKKKAFSEKYLGHLATDKSIITSIVQSPPMLGKADARDVVLRQEERTTVEKLNYLENCLWQRKPLYCYEYLQTKPSPRRHKEINELKKHKKKLIAEEIDRQFNKLQQYFNKSEWNELYQLADYIRTKVWSIPKDIMMCKQEYFYRIMNIVGDMYLKMKAFQKRWNADRNDKRLMVMIGLNTQRTAVYDLCKDSFHAPVLDIRRKIEEYKEYHRAAKDEYQLMYYNYEISCLYSMLGMWREARSYSKTCIFDARKQCNSVWYVNALFVYGRTEVQDENYHSAMVTFVAIREACRKFAYPEQEEFFNRVLMLLYKQPATKKIPQMMKSETIREQNIINLMPDFQLKTQFKSLLNRMYQKPQWMRLQLMKGNASLMQEIEEEPDEMKVALEEREIMKDDRLAAKKAKAHAAAAVEKKQPTAIPPIDGIDNYTMRKLISRYIKSSFNLDHFYM